MTDLETMLSNAGRSGQPHATPDEVVEADLTRGHRALAQRRMRRTGGRALVVGALVAGAFVVVQPQDSDTPSTSASAPVTSTQGSVAKPSINLVAYTGAQPEGFSVGMVPDGWEIQGVDNFVLVIARKGDPDTHIDSYIGKLVVTLQSKGEPDRTDGKEVTVGTATGRIVRDGDPDAARLFFKDAAGHRLVVQVPAELHWSDAQIIEFGKSVHANENADASVG